MRQIQLAHTSYRVTCQVVRMCEKGRCRFEPQTVITCQSGVHIGNIAVALNHMHNTQWSHVKEWCIMCKIYTIFPKQVPNT